MDVPTKKTSSERHIVRGIWWFRHCCFPNAGLPLSAPLEETLGVNGIRTKVILSTGYFSCCTGSVYFAKQQHGWQLWVFIASKMASCFQQCQRLLRLPKAAEIRCSLRLH